jgi:hypothetical protein
MIWDVHPGSRIRNFFHPGSRIWILDPGSRIKVKKASDLGSGYGTLHKQYMLAYSTEKASTGKILLHTGGKNNSTLQANFLKYYISSLTSTSTYETVDLKTRS